MTPEYIEQLAQRADPDELWRLNPFKQMELPPDKRIQLDTAVALRRYAHRIKDLNFALEKGKSMLITPYKPDAMNTAVKFVKIPKDHDRDCEKVTRSR